MDVTGNNCKSTVSIWANNTHAFFLKTNKQK